MTTANRFGTSAWRAIVGDESTVANIGPAGAGMADDAKDSTLTVQTFGGARSAIR